MERLAVAICEDMEMDRTHLRGLLERSGVPVRVEEFDQGGTFLTAFRPEAFDLIFMDIYLGDISGVEVVRQVRQQDRYVAVAFTTFSPDFALEGYRLDVSRYIEKPASQEAVADMLRLGRERRALRDGVSVELEGRTLTLPAHRLRYVEQRGHYLLLHLEDQTVTQVRGRLDELAPQLSGFPFFRCHKSYLANLSFVAALDREQMVFQMRGGGSAYIRRGNLPRAREALEQWMFASVRKMGG